MKKRALSVIAAILAVWICFSVSASAELLDKDASPAEVVTSGSFESTSQTRMDFSVSGGTLTGAGWSYGRHYAIYSLSGTCKEGEAISLSVTGTQAPGVDDALVFNILTVKLTFRDGNYDIIGEEQSYTSDAVKSSPLSYQMEAAVPSGAKTVAITGTFNCRWATSVVVEESVAVMVNLEVESEEEAAPIVPAPEEPSEIIPAPEDPEYYPPVDDSEPSDSEWEYGWPECENCEEDEASEHAGPLATALISLIAAIAAALGGAAGGAAGGAIGGLAGTTSTAEPESMVVTVSPNGAQILIVRDPVTGGWVNAETGNPFDLEAHQKSFPEQQKQHEEFIKHNEGLEKTGKTAIQQALDQISRNEKEGFDAIQKEIDQRRMEQLRRNQESLEWEQKHAQKTSGWGRIIGDTFRRSVGESVDTAKTIGKGAVDAVVWTGETLGTAAGTLIYDPERALEKANDAYESTKKTLGAVKDAVVGAANEVWNKPWILVKAVMVTGKAVVDTVTDPKKAWEVIKGAVGVDDFEKSLDPNRPLINRIGYSLTGTFKLATSVMTALKGAAALKNGVGKLVGIADDVAGAGGKALSSKTVASGIENAAENAAVKKAIPNVPKYISSGKAPELSGMTKTAQRQLQKISEKELVKIKVRPTTKNAAKLINSGKAVPKEMDLKPKTVDWRDSLIGGPKDAEGAVGFFRPTKPSAEAMKSLTSSQKAQVLERFGDRMKEYQKYGRDLDSMSDKYQVIDKKVYQKVTVGVEQNGKTTQKSVLKMVTGDNDVADITNMDGSPLPPDRKRDILDMILDIPESDVRHDDLLSWKPGDFAYNEDAKTKMVNDMMENGKGVVSFSPHEFPSHEYLAAE